MVYTIITMTALVGICSLAVDVGHVQEVKTELQSCADATARGYMEYYIVYGQTYANSNGPSIYSEANNTVDSSSGISPTTTVTWGFWNTATNSFDTSSGAYTAVQVTVSRTKANNNAVALTWGTVIGQPTCDVTVTSVAASIGTTQTVSFTVSATDDPYLAGMPSGSTASVDDTTSNAAPYQVPSITVTPGSILTFSSVTGSTAQASTGYSLEPPTGWSGNSTNHTPGGGENGIGDATAWLDSLMGVFLGPDAPNTNSAPAAVDWTNSANINKTQYNNLVIQQPFYIGNGQTTGGVVEQFVVPPTATRLYLASWDGYEWNNNLGSFSGTVKVNPTVQIMK
jgi:hypothetical protein